MSKKKEIREGEVLSYILSNMDKEFECDTDFTNLPTMSRATAFRVFAGLDKRSILAHMGEGKYRIPIPPRMMKYREGLVRANIKAFKITCMAASLMEDLFPLTVQTFEDDIGRCSSCPHLDPCIKGDEVECPVSQMRPVADETRFFDLLSIDQEDQEEEGPVSNETQGPRGDPGGDSPDRIQAARSLLRGKLDESREAKKDRPPSIKQQVKDVRAEWVEVMAEYHGVQASPWGGKEHKMVPKLLNDHGLELTKKAIRLYLKSWSEIRAENAWIDTDIPTFGLFWHFREMVFGAAAGKGVIGGRARKRTADECHDDDEEHTEGWGDADEASSAPSA